MLKNPVVIALVVAAALRGVGLMALFNWTAFYLEKDLEFGHFSTGVHIALLTGTGIIAAPALGFLSDRYGRKQVLVPGLAIASVLALLVVSAGDGILLAFALAGLGLFSFSLQQIILAMTLDVTGRGTEATTTGLIFGLNGILGGASPFIATAIIEHWGGYGSVYYYAGILTGVSGVLMLLVPTTPNARRLSRPR